MTYDVQHGQHQQQSPADPADNLSEVILFIYCKKVQCLSYNAGILCRLSCMPVAAILTPLSCSGAEAI